MQQDPSPSFGSASGAAILALSCAYLVHRMMTQQNSGDGVLRATCVCVSRRVELEWDVEVVLSCERPVRVWKFGLGACLFVSAENRLGSHS